MFGLKHTKAMITITFVTQQFLKQRVPKLDEHSAPEHILFHVANYMSMCFLALNKYLF